MSAVAREIVHALNMHPNSMATLSKDSVCILLAENNDENESLNEKFKTLFPSAFIVTETKPYALTNLATNSTNVEAFDAVILSNVFSAIEALKNPENLSKLLTAVLTMTKSSGIVIIRENLDGNTAQALAEITKFLDLFSVLGKTKEDKTKIFGLEFYSMNQVQDSIYAKSNFFDVYWTLTKTMDEYFPNNNENEFEQDSNKAGDAKLRTFRDFLDRTQFTEDNVLSYEWIFGDNFISPGGIDENRRILKYYQKLAPGQRMLDIGVGIGGGARQAAKEFGVRVLGCDLSSNMISHAFERNQRDKDHRVEYQIADATTYLHPANSFDAVFSRDCIQHIQPIEQLFANIFKWLKPGGEFLVTMYGKGYGELQPKFLEYVAQRKYHLKNLQEFIEIAKKVGFVNIYTENMTSRFEEILHAEQQKVLDNKDDFIKKFGEKLYNKHLEGWADKLQFIRDDNHNWLLLRAEKPYIILK